MIKYFTENPLLTGMLVISVLVVLIIFIYRKSQPKEIDITKLILEIIQQQRYYKGGMIDENKVYEDKEKIVEVLKKCTIKPHEQYFNASGICVRYSGIKFKFTLFNQ